MWLHSYGSELKWNVLITKGAYVVLELVKTTLQKKQGGCMENLEKPEQLKHPGVWRRLILNPNVHVQKSILSKLMVICVVLIHFIIYISCELAVLRH